MASIKKEMASGVFYIAISKYSGMLIQVGITAILARMLVPEDYGIIAIATVFINFFNILGDIGIGPAVIQNQTLEKKDYDNLFSTAIYLGLILATLFFLCSWSIALYYKKEILVPVCQSLSLLSVLYCVSIVPKNLLFKEKRFKLVSFANVVINTVSGILAIIAAYNGFGVYSLVFTYIFSSIVETIFYLYKKPLSFVFKPGTESIRKIFSFSIYQFMFNLINYFGRNLDKMLIGRFAGLQPLGYYEKSYRLMLLPLQNITFVLSPVLLPIFSTLQDNLKELADKYTKMLKMMAYIGFPLSVILFFCSRELILVFFGDQWEGAISPFKVLSLTVGMQMLTSSTGAVFQSINKTKQMFYAGCWGAFFMITSFIITLNVWGTITSVACGYFVAQLANTVQCFYLILRALDYSIRKFVISLIKPFSVGVVVCLVLIVLSYTTDIENLFGSLFIKGGIGVITSIILVHLTGDYDLLGMVKEIIKK